MTGSLVIDDIECDKVSSCPDGHTCCKTSTGEWACCPLPEVRAVCCPDLKHCCPAGFSCDPTTGECTQTNLLTWDPLLQNRRRDFRRPGL
uniref:Granulins domain-containing protein n=1 Tax=Periophthalmus magnuspinnatus TaxID=409849 RepID=A0A3B4AMK1_9GOBI